MRRPSRFALLALGAPICAFLLVLGVSLAAFRLGDDEGHAAAPGTSARAPEGNGRLVVTLNAGTSEPGEDYLASVSLDGSDVQPITGPPDGGIAADGGASVSPDGRTIAFQRSIPGSPPYVYLVGMDGSGLRRLTEGADAELTPAWSPDGSRIAFSRAEGDRFDLYVADADGSNLVRLTSTPNADEDGPSWSPNGEQIAFTRFRDDDEDLWVIDADGADLHALLRGPHDDSSPAWAADGSRIAIVRDGRIGVFTFERFDVGLLTPTSPVKDAGPSWSPDGARLAFTRDPGTIVVMGADGSRPTPIPLDGQATGAVWVPPP